MKVFEQKGFTAAQFFAMVENLNPEIKVLASCMSQQYSLDKASESDYSAFEPVQDFYGNMIIPEFVTTDPVVASLSLKDFLSKRDTFTMDEPFESEDTDDSTFYEYNSFIWNDNVIVLIP